MRYFISIHNEDGQYNAASKAPHDVAIILRRNGWQEITVRLKSINNSLFCRLYKLFLSIQLLIQFRKQDEILCQYPFNLQTYFAFILRLKYRRPKLAILVHDLNELRTPDAQSCYPLIKLAEKVIVHTPAMKDYIIKKGIRPDAIRVLYFFDYLVDAPRKVNTSLGKIITFAGNLNKSEFLSYIPTIPALNTTRFALYGANCPESLKKIANIDYYGKFSPNDIEDLVGDWGLVWDGNNIETCATDNTPSFGNYLRYNSSHKMSLYLAAGMPLIVWKQSGLANYIISHHLGVTIASLADIPNAINLSQQEINILRQNVMYYSKSIRNGDMLIKVLE